MRWPIFSILVETSAATSWFLRQSRLRQRAFGRGQAVELPADLRQRAQRQVAQQKCRQQRHNQRKAHQPEGFPEQRLVDGAQQRGVNAHVHGRDQLAVVFKRRHDVKDLGLAKDLHHHPAGAGLEELRIVGPQRQRLALVVGIGAQQRDALAVADVHVVHR